MGARICVIIALALLVAGCVSNGQRTTPVGASYGQAGSINWSFETKEDRITGKTSPSLSIAPSAARYNGRTGFASAAVTCSNKSPAVLFAFDFPVGATHNSVVGYRFDQKPGRQPTVQFLNTKAPVIIDEVEAKKFLSDAKDSSSLYVKISSPVGVSEVEFNTSGGNATISQFEQACYGV